MPLSFGCAHITAEGTECYTSFNAAASSETFILDRDTISRHVTRHHTIHGEYINFYRCGLAIAVIGATRARWELISP